jgi:hypothetical protein
VETQVLHRGHLCRFKLADVICPDRQQVLGQITPAVQVSGRVVFLSDEGERKDCYAVIEVDGIGTPLIVPVERLTRDQTTGTEAEGRQTPSGEPHI